MEQYSPQSATQQKHFNKTPNPQTSPFCPRIIYLMLQDEHSNQHRCAVSSAQSTALSSPSPGVLLEHKASCCHPSAALTNHTLSPCVPNLTSLANGICGFEL